MPFLLADFETTGLDPEVDVPIEIAARVLVSTPAQGPREIARYHSLITPHHGVPEIWQQHLDSGLWVRANTSGQPLEEVENQLLSFVDDHVSRAARLHLMGNSVHFDRRFFRRYMPRVDKRLHYRHLDATSVRLWQQLFTDQDPLNWDLEITHDSERDCDATLEALTIYAQRLGLYGG